ncbi:uncharacterized protein LOC131299224 isoform X2 [Rhododendron vialii]|uniref:uncharacterized protein LOC131299224 isoform X2 n=1 Tax=Rhododendron vialii TaxID=182163 RepID=UPI00265E6DFE|nr:uncharacterized protein LOC131299224 isoform X2 [Rhododendron vialii]
MATAAHLFQRSLHAATAQLPNAAAAVNCFSFRNLATAWPPRLHPITLKLQNGVMQNHICSYLPSSAFCNGVNYENCFKLKFKQLGVSCAIKDNQLRVLRPTSVQNFLTFRSLGVDESKRALTSQPQINVVGYSSSVVPSGMFGYGMRSPYCVDYAKRHFSHVPRAVTDKNDKVGFSDGRNNEKTSAVKVFNKHWKQAKSFGAHKRNEAQRKNASNSTDTQLKGTDMVNSREQIMGNGVEDASLGPSVSNSHVGNKNKLSEDKGKHKQQSRSKKSKGQSCGTNAAIDAATKPEGSEKVSQAKIPNTTAKNQSLPATENSTTNSKPLKVLDSSVSTKQQCRSIAGKNHIEGKSTNVFKVTSEKESTKIKKTHPSSKAEAHEQRRMQPLYPPRGKSVVVVESVTKAKVIQGYLGDMFEVVPSHGHIRDLAARSGSVRPDDDFSMLWEVPSTAWTHLKSIKVALSGAENLILASDPDREGEAIAWHIIEMLQQQDALREGMTIARVVFNEITESSIKSALRAPRGIDVNLVHAYLARRALDYLIGFNIAPLLWKKLPGCQSAGRVQSAALSLICDREMEIDQFKPKEYWKVEVQFNKRGKGSITNKNSFSSYLTHFDSTKLLSISCQTEAKNMEQKISSSNFEVVASKRNKIRKNPPAPYTTSTFQQDAAYKLHFTTTYSMKLAQRLYEGVELSDDKAAGLITYPRTDGFHISDEVMKDIHALAIERYGQDFASKTPRKYFKKVKNAQEGHEAIRPTDIRRLPSTLVGILDEDSLKLYALIWARTVACQMEPTNIGHIKVEIGNADQSIALRSTCSTVEFIGYQAVYKDLEAKAIKNNEDGNGRDEAFNILNNLKPKDMLSVAEVELMQHHTQPPLRYSEELLVKKLEELGIGRPSTYASTVKVLQDRKYVTIQSQLLFPDFRGRMVSAFLSHHFSEVTDYSFIADMETELDNVSAGLTEWKGLLGDYWTRFKKYCDRTANVHIHQVEKMMEKTFGDLLFGSLPYKSRKCPSCSEGKLVFKVSRFGAAYFIGCDQHPKCKFIAKTLYGDDEEVDTPQNENTVEPPKLLGLHPDSNEKILLKNGPYGCYIQLGVDRKGYSPKRASVPQVKHIDSVTLEDAIELLRYPVTLGKHPEDDRPVEIKLARLGFSIRHRHTIAQVPKNMNVSDITLEKALKLLLGKDVKRCGRPKKKPKLEEAIETM